MALELVAAKPGQDVRARCFSVAATLLSTFVSRGVAEPIVDLLEMIEIDEKNPIPA